MLKLTQISPSALASSKQKISLQRRPALIVGKFIYLGFKTMGGAFELPLGINFK